MAYFVPFTKFIILFFAAVNMTTYSIQKRKRKLVSCNTRTLKWASRSPVRRQVSKLVGHDIHIRRQNRRKTPQRRRVAFMTVQTDRSSAAAKTCSVTGCCHAVMMANCSTLWDRERRRCAGQLTSALLAGRQAVDCQRTTHQYRYIH